jgi:hypothetical protein
MARHRERERERQKKLQIKLLISQYLISCIVDITSYSLWNSVSPKGQIYYNFFGSKILKSIMSTVTVSK